jgi:hypothetical protein
MEVDFSSDEDEEGDKAAEDNDGDGLLQRFERANNE